jgi:glycosyltransferase involved in cell wall biosynthesis
MEEAILSVLDQQYPDLELLIADGGSTDNSVGIIKKYENRIKWWVSEKDRGQSHAINKGLNQATGEIINWINSDDLLMPGALQQVASCFASQPADVGLIHGGTILFKGSNDIKTDWGYKNPCLERNLAGMAFSQPSAFFLKKYFDKIGGQLNDQLHFGMDYDLYCKLACVCRFVPVQDVFTKYRLHEESKSVAAADNFIGDWSRTFVSLCRNLRWDDLLQQMQVSGFFEKNTLDYFEPFGFTPDQTIIRPADKSKILFYHYAYVLKAFYWSGRLDKAKQLLKLMKAGYPGVWLKEEKDIPPIIKKMALPAFVLRILKKIRNSI